jgi:hypothetical protein
MGGRREMGKEGCVTHGSGIYNTQYVGKYGGGEGVRR